MVMASAKSVDARAPVLTEQEQDGGNERAGVADTDPEDEVNDRKAPRDRLIVTPHADAGQDQVHECNPGATPRSVRAIEKQKRTYHPRPW
jgi:hypothetical protein